MTDLELLDEVLEHDLGSSIAELIGPASAALYVKTRDAARAYRDFLVNVERVLYCDEHRAQLLSTDNETGEQFCWKHHMNFIPSKVPYTPCRMVSKLLSDYPKEAENE